MEVEVRHDQAVVTVTLNRPDVLNALNRAVHDGLAQALDDAKDPGVRAVVITGAGRGFCVGQDLAELPDYPDGLGELLTKRYHPLISSIRALQKPVIAAVNGPAAGAGLSLACACDIRVASDDASFVPAFINIGLVPDAGGSLFLQRLLGTSRAFEWMGSGRKLSAQEALDWRLVSEVVEAAELPGRVAQLSAQLAAQPTRALGLMKRLFDTAATATLEQQLALEAELQDVAAGTEDFDEGVAAFLEKRKPAFVGR